MGLACILHQPVPVLSAMPAEIGAGWSDNERKESLLAVSKQRWGTILPQVIEPLLDGRNEQVKTPMLIEVKTQLIQLVTQVHIYAVSDQCSARFEARTKHLTLFAKRTVPE